VQQAREAVGQRRFLSDPLNYRFRRDDGDGVPLPADMLSDDELELAVEELELAAGEDGEEEELPEEAEEDEAAAAGAGAGDEGAGGGAGGSGDGAKASAASSASTSSAGTGDSGAAVLSPTATARVPTAQLSRADKFARYARRLAQGKEAKLRRDIGKSEQELRVWTETGIGAQMRGLRGRAHEYAAAHSGGAAAHSAGGAAPAGSAGSAAADAGGAERAAGVSPGVAGAPSSAAPTVVRAALRGVPRHRVPTAATGGATPPSASSGTAAAAAGTSGGSGTARSGPGTPEAAAELDPHLLLPFGPGPHSLQVRLRRPAYSRDAHELYARFNMALHRGRPSDNSAAGYTRHLVTSPLLNMHASDVGYLYRLACALPGRAPVQGASPAAGGAEGQADLFAALDISAGAAGSTAGDGRASPLALPGLFRRHERLTALSTQLQREALAPSELASAMVASIAACDALCAWLVSTVARRLETQERAKLAVSAGGGRGVSTSASSSGAAAGAGAAAAAPDPGGDPLPLVQAVPPLPAALDEVAASLVDIAGDMGLPPCFALAGLLALGEELQREAETHGAALQAHLDASAAAASAAAAAASTAAAGGGDSDDGAAAGGVKRARLDDTGAYATAGAGGSGSRSDGGSQAAQGGEEEEDAMAAQLAELLGLPADALAGLGFANLKSAGVRAAAAGPVVPPRPIIPPAWLAPGQLMARLTNILIRGEDTLLWLFDAAAGTLEEVHGMVAAAAAYEAERSAPVPPPSDAVLSCFFERAPAQAQAADGGAADGGAAAASADGRAPSAPAPAPGETAAAATTRSGAAPSASAPGIGSGGGGPRIAVEGWDLSLGFGTFFHEYWLADTLVAVSVLDVLPSRVASVYFFYNPSLRYLELGKLSALVEVWLTQQVYAHCAAQPGVLGLPPALPPLCRWWDANFYVHSCTSMAYKRRFAPSQLLCPRVHRGHWVDLSPAIVRRLDDDPAAPLGTHRTWPPVQGQPAGAPGYAAPTATGAGAASGGGAGVGGAGAVSGAVGSAPAPLEAVAARVAEEAESAAASLEFAEAEEAEALLPLTMQLIPPEGRQAFLHSQLTEGGQQMLQRGMRRFMRAAGPQLTRRLVLDPAWLAGLESQRKGEEADLAAFRARKAAEAAALTGGASTASVGDGSEVGSAAPTAAAYTSAVAGAGTASPPSEHTAHMETDDYDDDDDLDGEG
jgi:hypothetical protein